jgi:RNA polymerase sigma-70 factor (ECF subfamily)
MRFILPKKGDDYLAGKVRDGDERSFTLLYNIYCGPLAYFVESIINDYAEAGAIASETMEKVWKLRQNFTSMEDIRAFMYVSSRNAAYDHISKVNTQRKREELTGDLNMLEKIQSSEGIEEDVSAELLWTRVELLHQMLTEIETLKSKRKKVLHLLIKGMKPNEVARQLDTTESNVYALKNRAIKDLRKKLRLARFLLLPMMFWKNVS